MYNVVLYTCKEKRAERQKGEVIFMNKIVVPIVTRKNSDGTVSAENGFIFTPEIHFSGNRETKWYKDTYKQSACSVSA